MSTMEERDRRRPITWDWFLCFLCPINTIAYHHRRASLTLTHVFCLIFAGFVANLVGTSLSFIWLRDFLADLTVASKDQDGFVAGMARMPIEQRVQLITDFIKASPKMAVLESMSSMLKLFSFATVGFAIYVVVKANMATVEARKELVEGYLVSGSTMVPSASAHPLLASPKGTGSAFLSYAIAVMFPSAAYALNADRRRVYYGVAILNAILQIAFILLLSISMAAVGTPSVGSPVVSGLVSSRLVLATVAMFLMILALPIRMAVMNVYRARLRFAKTLTIE